MEFFTTIVAAAILCLGLVITIPVSVFFSLNIERQTRMAVGFRFLGLKYRFPIKKKPKAQKTVAREKRQKDKQKPSPARPKGQMLLLFIYEHGTMRETAAALGLFAKNLAFSIEQYYLDMNLSGGLRSPDLTGQFFGLVQVCRSIPTESLSLSFYPSFTDDELRGTVDFGIVFRIYKIIKQVIILFWRLPLIQLIKIYRKYRKE